MLLSKSAAYLNAQTLVNDFPACDWADRHMILGVVEGEKSLFYRGMQYRFNHNKRRYEVRTSPSNISRNNDKWARKRRDGTVYRSRWCKFGYTFDLFTADLQHNASPNAVGDMMAALAWLSEV